MIKIKKTVSLLGALLLLLLPLSGCHTAGNLKQFQIPETFDSSQNYEITFWAKNDTNKAQAAIYEKAARDFEKLYPNVTVNIRLYTDYSKIYNDVITNISTNTTPNVCITYPDHIATYMTGSNVVVSLDELFADSKYGLAGSEVKFDAPTYDEIVPNFLEECKIEDKYYAVPYMRSTEACYVNKTYIEAMGYTLPETLSWDFVWEVSEAATKKNADGTFALNGQNVMIPFIYKSTDNMMIQTLKQLNADYSDSTGNVLMFNDTTKEFLYGISKHVESGAFSTFKISSYPGNFFNAGQCLFAIDSTAGSTWIGSKAPLIDIDEKSVVDFETVVYPVPQYDTSNPRMISQGPSICIFNKEDPGEVLASWLFTQFLLTNEVQTNYARTEGYVPVTLKAQSSPEYQDYLSRRGEDDNDYYSVKIDATNILLNNLDNTFVTPVFNGSASLRSASGQLIESVATSTRRKQTVDEMYIDNLYKEMISLYHLDSVSVGTSKRNLGPLPVTAKLLLISLLLVWICMGSIYLYKYVKTKDLFGKK